MGVAAGTSELKHTSTRRRIWSLNHLKRIRSIEEAEIKSKQLNLRRRIRMRATVEVETSHRLFRAPKGDNGGSGGKKWAIQVEVQRSQTFGERRVSSRLEREPEDPLRRKISHEDPLRSVRKKSRKVSRECDCIVFGVGQNEKRVQLQPFDLITLQELGF